MCPLRDIYLAIYPFKVKVMCSYWKDLQTFSFSSPRKDNKATRLRKWLVARLISIVENHAVKKEEDLVMDVARWVWVPRGHLSHLLAFSLWAHYGVFSEISFCSLYVSNLSAGLIFDESRVQCN